MRLLATFAATVFLLGAPASVAAQGTTATEAKPSKPAAPTAPHRDAHSHTLSPQAAARSTAQSGLGAAMARIQERIESETGPKAKPAEVARTAARPEGTRPQSAARPQPATPAQAQSPAPGRLLRPVTLEWRIALEWPPEIAQTIR